MAEITKSKVLEFIEAAYAECQALKDGGDQLHRRAATGRLLYVHVHGWDKWANNGAGGMAVTLRVDGQYVNRGIRFVAATRENANEFATKVRAALVGMLPPIPGEPFTAGRPVEMTGGKRVNLYLDAPSLARADELGGGNVSEGVRIALAK